MLFFANSKAEAIDYSPNGTTGLNLVYNGIVDDTFFTVSLPWTVSFLGSNYGTVYVGSNGYITFASGNSTYSGFSPSNPGGPHISIIPGDRYLKKLYYAQINAGTADAKFVIRVEGVIIPIKLLLTYMKFIFILGNLIMTFTLLILPHRAIKTVEPQLSVMDLHMY